MQGKFGLRIIFKDGSKTMEWFIEEVLRNTEYKRYKRSAATLRVRKVNK